MQPAAAGMFVEELQSPTKQEIAEILDVNLSPRCRRSEDAAIVRDDKRMVETETLRETLDDGYRRDLLLFETLMPFFAYKEGRLAYAACLILKPRGSISSKSSRQASQSLVCL